MPYGLFDGVTQESAGKILVGTASWSDPGFVEKWYPKKMSASERLRWYAHHFEMVEVYSTFYSVPDLSVGVKPVDDNKASAYKNLNVTS